MQVHAVTFESPSPSAHSHLQHCFKCHAPAVSPTVVCLGVMFFNNKVRILPADQGANREDEDLLLRQHRHGSAEESASEIGLLLNIVPVRKYETQKSRIK